MGGGGGGSREGTAAKTRPQQRVGSRKNWKPSRANKAATTVWKRKYFLRQASKRLCARRYHSGGKAQELSVG